MDCCNKTLNLQSKLDKIKKIVSAEINYQDDYSIKQKDYTLLKQLQKILNEKIK